MSDSLASVKKLIDSCSEEDRKAVKLYVRQLVPHPLENEWGIDADAILTAINRSSDLTKRGVRGIIAEAVFVNEVLPTITASGWQSVTLNGDHPYDALLSKGPRAARIQVKLQRLERGVPKLYYANHYPMGTLFVVEVQKTRSGQRMAKTKGPEAGAGGQTEPAMSPEKTRPYSFEDFDILAVNMHPSSGDWKNFRYTLTSWLLPRVTEPDLIEIFQPVAAEPNEVWTNDLTICLEWFENGMSRSVLEEVRHPRKGKATN